jgi:LysR family cyn operon transcriptional activator
VLEITELAGESLLLLRRDFASRVVFDTACHIARIKPRVILESAAPHTLLALARTGNGVAIVPSNVHIAPFVSCRSCTVVHRSEDWSSLLGISSVIWRPMPNSSSTN